MMPHNSEQIRDRLRAHLGDEKYAKFASSVPLELRYWQKKAWERFLAENPDCELNPEEMVEVFSDCPEYGAKVQEARQLSLIKSWLGDQFYTFEEVETQYPISLAHPRGLLLKADIQPGDQLQSFCSPTETWGDKSGREGIALVRNGEVIQFVVTVLN